MMRMPLTLPELGAGSVVLRVVRTAVLTGPAMLQRRVLRDLHAASNAEVEKNLLVMKQTLWKNNLNFVNDVCMLYVHFITILIIVFEKKREALLSYLPSYLMTLPTVQII